MAELQSGKKKVVVDIQGLDKIIQDDAYSMSLQTNIIAAVARCLYITIIDVRGYFHQ